MADILDTQAVRTILKTRQHLLVAGYPATGPEVETLHRLARGYAYRVGVARYLSEMLGTLAVVPAAECQVTGPGQYAGYRAGERVLDWLRRLPTECEALISVEGLPWGVKVGEEERYL